MQKQHITIIGGSGFIGTRLCDRLKKRTDITFTVADINKSERYGEQWMYCDIRKPETIAPAIDGADIVINLAAEHKDNVSPTSKYYDTNVQGQENLCSAMDNLGIKNLLFTSSVAVYGFVTAETGESGKINPFNAYGDSKYKAELKAISWFESEPDTKQLSVLRPTVVFGEENRGNVYNLLKQVASGRFIMIGNGKNKKSMAYVENIAAFLEHLIGKGKGHQVFNFVDKPDFDMNSLIKTINLALKRQPSKLKLPYALGLTAGFLVDIISKISGKELPISRVRVQKFAATTLFKSDTDMAGFTPPVKLQEGIKRTIQNELI